MSKFSKGNFVAFHRGEQADILQQKHPAAFLLLCQIARRARYTEEPCQITGLQFGEAFIGDWKEAGLTTRKSYRCARDRLKALRLCDFRRATTGVNRGTVATLLPQGIFSISNTGGASRGASQGPLKGHQEAIEGPQITKEPRNDETKEPNKSPKGDWDGIFPKGSSSKSKSEQKRIKVLQNNPNMIHIGKWFDRKEDTFWTVAEARILQDLNPNREEVELMAKYRDTPNEFHRRDICTLLNNWHTELDRARTAGSHKGEDRSEKRRGDAQERRAV